MVASNCNIGNTTLYPVTVPTNTGPRTLEYLLPRADVLRPNTHVLTRLKLYHTRLITTANCWQTLLAVADDQESESLFSKELAPYYLPRRYPHSRAPELPIGPVR